MYIYKNYRSSGNKGNKLSLSLSKKKKDIEKLLFLEMGRSPCCSKEGLNRGAWTAIEDKILTDYIKAHGDGKWRSLPKAAGQKLISLINYTFSRYIFKLKLERFSKYEFYMVFLICRS